MANESQMWRDHVRDVLRWARLDPVRIENSSGLGTADVNYLHGWIELKNSTEWPVRAKTPLRLSHFTPQQRVFLKRRWLRGGHAWLLLRVGSSEFFLFDGVWAAEHVGLVDRDALVAGARVYCSKGFLHDQFIPVLTSPTRGDIRV